MKEIHWKMLYIITEESVVGKDLSEEVTFETRARE